METISFTKAVKLVHPDLNPNIMDAGDKMRTLKIYRNDERKMFLYLLKWGLVKSVENGKEEPEENKIKFERFTIQPNRIYNGHAVVYVNKLGYCIVQRTTAKRVYFHEVTKQKNGRTFCKFSDVVYAVRPTE